MPSLRNEKLFLALNLAPNAREAALVALINQTRALGNGDSFLQTLSLEPSLVHSTLVLANSAYFKHKITIHSLEQARAVLGINVLAKLALLGAISEMISRPFTPYNIETAAVWDIAVLSATIMEHCARYHEWPPLHAHAMGLFHAFGRVVLNDYILTEPNAPQAPKMDYFAITEWERKHIGMSHAAAAAVMMVKWGFDEAFYRPIQFQNRPMDAGTHHQGMAAMLHIAMRVAAHITLPALHPESFKSIQPEFFALARLPWRDFYSLEAPARMALMQTHHILTNIHPIRH